MKVKIFMVIMALCLTTAVSAQNKSNSNANANASSSTSTSTNTNTNSSSKSGMQDGNMNACHAIMMDGMSQEQMMEYMAKNMNNGMMSTCPMGQNNTSGSSSARK